MKMLKLLPISFITLAIIANAQTVIPPGDVSGTWAFSGSPYLIQGEIRIPDGLTLNIEPKVVVEFQGHYKLNVQGRLLAIGTETDTITFTINDTTGFHDPNIPVGSWHGVRFINNFSNDSSKIVYCKLEYGKAVGPDWPDQDGGAILIENFDKLTIENCLITNNIAGGMDWPGGGGIALINSNPRIISNTISNNWAWDGGAIQCYQSSPVVENNFIEFNTAKNGGGILCNSYSYPTITNTTIENNIAEFGGGINCYESSPQIVNSLIKNNSAESGGGIVCNEYSNPNILNTIIEYNTANSGGGIVCWNYSGPILNGVTFRNNSAIGWTGGAISSYTNNLQINNCIFEENNASFMGGAVFSENDNLQIDSCIFEENNAGVMGGAINFTCGDTLNITYQLIMTNTSFNNNSATITGGTAAGCADSAKADIFIDKCSFTNNFATICSGLLLTGGLNNVDYTLSNSIFSANEALEFAAGCSFSDCSGTVSNCLFNSNAASTGGGNYGSGGLNVWSNSNIDIMNCTFADNTAAGGAGLGVGMGSIVTTTNCIFWGNNTDQIALDDTLYGLGSTLNVNYCDIQGGEDSVNVIDPSLSTLNWGDGNIDSDPLFVDTLFRLSNISPCLEKGIDSINIGGTMYYCPKFCLHGIARPSPAGTYPDIGACENPNPVSVKNNNSQVPYEYSLAQNYPNPFNPTTKIKYQIPELSFVILKVYDLLGNEIKTIVNEEKPIGTYELTWNAENLPSGVYFYQLRADSFVDTKKMILIK